MSTDYRKMSHHFIEKAFSSHFNCTTYFCVVKKFLPVVKSRVWGRAGGRPGPAATTTTRCGDKQPGLPSGGGGGGGRGRLPRNMRTQM